MDLFGFRVCFFVVCALLEVDFWIIFGCKKCAQTIFMYSSAMDKNRNYWRGGWRSNIGEDVSPIPPGFAALLIGLLEVQAYI